MTDSDKGALEATATILSCPLFNELPEEEIEFLANQAAVRKYRKHAVIISIDDETDAIYIIQSGRVRVFCDNDQGRQMTLNFHGPGGHFGELAAMCDAPRIANVEAVEPTTTLVLPSSVFLQVLERQPAFGIRLARLFAQWVRLMSINITDLALLDVYGRVTRLLLRLAHEQDGQRVIDGMTHQELANQVGASREMVSRILGDLKTGNYIETEGRTIILKRDLPSGW